MLLEGINFYFYTKSSQNPKSFENLTNKLEKKIIGGCKVKTNIFTPNQNRIQTLENLTNKLKKKKKN